MLNKNTIITIINLNDLCKLLLKSVLGISLAFQMAYKLISDLEFARKSQDHPKDFKYYGDHVMHGS